MQKLLIADGSPTMHRIMELTFASERFQVVTAADGEQAIALLPIVKPDIVIADGALASRSGYEVAAFVRQQPELAHVPVLLLAGAFEPIDPELAERSGVSGTITKPFDPGRLITRVHELLAESRAARARVSAEPPIEQVEPEDVSPAPVAPLEEFLPEAAVDPGPGAVAADAVLPSLPAPDAAAADAVPPGPPAPDAVAADVVEPSSPAPDAAAPPGPAPADADEAPPPSRSDGRGTLDDYFNRLEAALSRLDEEMGPSRGGASPGRSADAEPAIPTLSSLLGESWKGSNWRVDEAARHEQPAPPAGGVDRPAPAPEPPPAHAEETVAAPQVTSDPSGSSSPVTPAAPAAASSVTHEPAPSAAPADNQALVDAIARRVLEQLQPGTASQIVSEVVTRVAERLLREELARTSKDGQGPGW